MEGEVNPVEKEAKVGGVGWLGEGEMDKWARGRVVKFLEKRVKELREGEGRRSVEVVLRSADPTVEDVVVSSAANEKDDDRHATPETLTIHFLTPTFYTDLFVFPSIPLALAIGSHTEHRWTTSSDDLFLSLFSSSSSSSAQSRSSKSISQSLRLQMMNWGLSFASSPFLASSSLIESIPNHHPLDETSSWTTSYMLAKHYWNLRLGYAIFVATGARFVEGMESWGEWKRFLEKERRGGGGVGGGGGGNGVGSVRRE